MTKPVPVGVRKAVRNRDGYQCRYCGRITSRLIGPRQCTIDHVVPTSRGGLSTIENCVVACQRCNQMKGDRLLEDTGLVLLPIPERITPWPDDADLPMPTQTPSNPPPVPGARWCADHGVWHWPSDPLPPLDPAELF